MKLSILMPVYNEEARLGEALKQALAVDYPCEIELIVVNDGSKDRTADILNSWQDARLRPIHHQRNKGKGGAIRTAVDAATGEYMIILDADLEYDPRDIPALIRQVVDRKAIVVYGNRSFGGHAAFSFWYVMGNKGVTLFANILFNSYIGDLETCYKMMPVELYRSLKIKSRGFGMEAEVTGKLLRLKLRPYEVPITYHARTREEGKKITAMDGVKALLILLRERLRPLGRQRRQAMLTAGGRGNPSRAAAPSLAATAHPQALVPGSRAPIPASDVAAPPTGSASVR